MEGNMKDLDLILSNKTPFIPNDSDRFHVLISWSLSYFSHLPWRINRTPYHTLISELMLQQTTVAGVIPKYLSFMDKYPSWESLTQASLEDILDSWKGLGYYQRPKSLFKLAQTYSRIEDLLTDLLHNVKLPGIGPYTQGALISIGLDRPSAALDANIRRVLQRYFQLPIELCLDQYLELLKRYSPRALNESLMDLGREICQARTALCDSCFLRAQCKSVQTIEKELEALRLNKKSKEKIELALVRLIVQTDDSHIIGIEKPHGTWLSGYIELPTFTREYCRSDSQYPVISDNIVTLLRPQSFYTMTNYITKFRLRSDVYLISESIIPDELKEWIFNTYPHAKIYKKSALWAKSSMTAIEKLISS